MKCSTDDGRPGRLNYFPLSPARKKHPGPRFSRFKQISFSFYLHFIEMYARDVTTTEQTQQVQQRQRMYGPQWGPICMHETERQKCSPRNPRRQRKEIQQKERNVRAERSGPLHT